MALHKGRAYERRTGIRVPQIVGIGSAPFRGGLAPAAENLDAVLETYPGAATLTVQSAFRYDHEEATVIGAAESLEKRLTLGWVERDRLPPGPDDAEVEALRGIVARWKQAYEASYRELLPQVSRVAAAVPSHRERYENVDVAGSARSVAGLPAVRAIKYAASCYTLGLPPGVLGFRAWEEFGDDERALVERTCPTLLRWLREELRFENEGNARLLSERHRLPLLARDRAAARAWAGEVPPDAAHDEASGRAPALLDDPERLRPVLMEAARIRGFLG